MAEQMANELRLPIVRLVDGTGGGGSVKTLETIGYTYVPANPGWELGRRQPGARCRSWRSASARSPGSARRGSSRSHYSLMVEGISQMFVAGPPVVARARRDGQQGGARRQPTSTRAQRRGRRRGRRARTRPSRGRGASSRICRRRSYELPTAQPSRRRSRAARGVADRGDPARPAQGLRHAADHRGRRRRGLVLRDRPQVRPLGRHRRSRGSTAGRSRCWRAIRTSTAAAGPPTRRRRSTRFVDLADTFHLPVVHLVDIPGFVIGIAGREGRHDPARRAGARRGLPGQGAVVLDHPAQVVRRRGRGAPEQAEVQFPLRLAVGRLGLAAARGRDRGRLQGRARGGARSGRAARRDRGAAQQVRSPFRTAERFGVEEIIDPRDTRPLLCEFANLAAPLRKPGPRSFGYRP